MNKLKRKNRGVKQAGFWVLHNTYMPSILVETGFISNKKEGDYLNSNVGKTQMATSISDAIPNIEDTLLINSEHWEIVQIWPIKPGDTSIAARVQVRA